VAVLDHTEAAFERLIVHELVTAGGWIGEDLPEGSVPRNRDSYDRNLGVYPPDFVEFVKATQPKGWAKLVSLSGGVEEAASAAIVSRLAVQLDKRGTIEVLRGGISDRGVRLAACYFEPELKLDPRASELYEANVLRVVRQVPPDPRGGDTVDLVLFVNGIPTATAELKNRFTGQDVNHAIDQYRSDRNPASPLFRRALVNFALDGDLAYMTSRLAGEATRFLPFNQGSAGPGQPGGKGNPPAPDPGSHPTSYMWRRVWERDAWMELLERFVFVEAPVDPKAKGARPTVIFPRYHQWDVVRDCAASARVRGPGHNYLIQHSAGSGKTKEIAWLAHELSTIHSTNGTKVFDKVVVITDRRVLDQQLQAQVLAFEQVKGTVQRIDRDSAQLREALAGETARVVITTLQKFPIVLRQLDESGAGLRARSYAVIVDEAHSSQSGESATDLKKVLGGKLPEDLDIDPDELDGVPPALLAQLAARGRQPNLSFFAFTATPKARTLELFGEGDGARGGELRAFHTYSMRQAIDEGFIVDVLAQYTTYDQLYRLEAKAGELEVPKGKAQARLAAYAKFHPHAKDQKAKVIVDHFHSVVRPLLGGEAKAMVVTASREEAVRYRQAIDRAISARGYDDVCALVAFSGEVTITEPEAADHGERYTEPQMNRIDGRGISEAKLPEEFDKPAYGLLIVAEKYQTGFDQPKLCAMYVDKKLAGVNAVQTLSRLNRQHPGKEAVYVLDFANPAEEILSAFEPYYERTEATPSDPNVLFDAAQKVEDLGLIAAPDLDRFAAEYFSGKGDHGVLSGATQAAFDRVGELDDDEREEAIDAIERFVRFHRFLSQVVSYLPPETERLYQFCHFLLLRLDRRAEGGAVNLAGTVELTHYRLEDQGATRLKLGTEEPEPLSAIGGDGTGRGEIELPMGLLGELVELFNERYGEQLSDADLIRPMQQIVERVSAEDGLREQAVGNDFDDFIRGKEGMVVDATLDVKGVNDELIKRILDDAEFRQRATGLVMRSLYDRFRADG